MRPPKPQKTYLAVTDTLPATRAADMVMADMITGACGVRSDALNADRVGERLFFIALRFFGDRGEIREFNS